MKKRLAAILAVIITVSSLTACGSNNNTDVDSSATAAGTTAADTTSAAATTAPLTEENLSKVVASVNKDGVDADYFDITYGDFNREYQFYLGNYGKDESNDADKEVCEQYRRSIIEFLTTERITLYIADQKGLGADSLTEDELAEINSSVEETLDQWYSSYEEEAKAALGDDASDEQVREKEIELFNAFMESCGLDKDIFYTWQKNSTVQGKLMESELADVTVTDDDISEFIDDTVAEAKECWETDPATFESNSTYMSVYVPEGTRNIREILLKFGDDDMMELSKLRSSGTDEDNETANELRETLADGKRSTADEIIKQLEEGKSFEELAEQYNEDTAGNYEFAVVPNSTLWTQEFQDVLATLENVGDYSEPIVTDYGLLIIQYSSDAAITDEEWENLRSDAREYLVYQTKLSKTNDLLTQWKTDYPYTIDYAALRLEDPNTVSSDGTADAE